MPHRRTSFHNRLEAWLMRSLKLKQKSPGLSLIISVILISIIVTFSIGVATLIVDSVRQGARVRRGTEAYYSAEAGIEQALLVNKKLKDQGEAIGHSAEYQPDEDHPNIPYDARFEIKGDAGTFFVKQLQGKYIVPFPWTGDVPFTDLEYGAKVEGGCDPTKPPQLTTDGNNFIIPDDASDDGNETAEVLEHPCNWGMLKPGTKVAIPLYYIENGSPKNLTDFTIRLRTPCFSGAEYCQPTDRYLLNCFDKGEEAIRCMGRKYEVPEQKGEVVVLWQIDAEAAGVPVSLTPLDVRYQDGQNFTNNSEIFEGKINGARIAPKAFTILKASDSFYGYISSITSQTKVKPDIGDPGKDAISVSDFLGDGTDIEKPILKLSVIGSLKGCQDNNCTVNSYPYDSTGNPKSDFTAPPDIPYLEYQIQFTGSEAPANVENILRSEGQSGPFQHTIEVKVPHQTSSLEYVIQQ